MAAVTDARIPATKPTMDQRATFEQLAHSYSWDMPLPEAWNWPDRLIRRVMDIGTLEDIGSLERAFGRDRLVTALKSAEAGSLRPKSWNWWHLRLGLVAPGGPMPPMPVRRSA